MFYVCIFSGFFVYMFVSYAVGHAAWTKRYEDDDDDDDFMS